MVTVVTVVTLVTVVTVVTLVTVVTGDTRYVISGRDYVIATAPQTSTAI